MADQSKESLIKMDAQASQNLALRAIESGAVFTGQTSLSWNLSGECTEPVSIVMHGRMPQGRNLPGLQKYGVRLREDVYAEYASRPWEVQLFAACRKCAACRRAKTRLWTRRIWQEWRNASSQKLRVIFLTLTVKPSVYLSWINDVTAENAVRHSWVPTDPQEDQLGAREKGIVKRFNYEWKMYVKRLRESGMKFRFVRVYEYQKQRRALHVHALIFESPLGERPLTVRGLKKAWQSRGFSHAKLCNEPPAAYLTKYVLKEHTLPGTNGSLLPIYASQHFGVTDELTRPEGITTCDE